MTWTTTQPAGKGIFWVVTTEDSTRTVVAVISDGIYRLGDHRRVPPERIAFWSTDPLAPPELPFDVDRNPPLTCRTCFKPLIQDERDTNNDQCHKCADEEPIKDMTKIGIRFLPSVKALCAATSDNELAEAAIFEVEALQEKAEQHREEADVMYDRYRRVLLERDEARESERSLLAQVRKATPATDEVERLRQREVMLSELLWQAWRCLQEGAGETVENFLRHACINEGIMDESGGKLPVARAIGRAEMQPVTFAAKMALLKVLRKRKAAERARKEAGR